MNLTSTLSLLGSAAASLATSIVPGASMIEEVIKAGKSLGDAFNSAKAANGGTAPADAQAGHDALMKKVNAHADGTLSRLDG